VLLVSVLGNVLYVFPVLYVYMCSVMVLGGDGVDDKCGLIVHNIYLTTQSNYFTAFHFYGLAVKAGSKVFCLSFCKIA